MIDELNVRTLDRIVAGKGHVFAWVDDGAGGGTGTCARCALVWMVRQPITAGAFAIFLAERPCGDPGPDGRVPVVSS